MASFERGIKVFMSISKLRATGWRYTPTDGFTSRLIIVVHTAYKVRVSFLPSAESTLSSSEQGDSSYVVHFRSLSLARLRRDAGPEQPTPTPHRNCIRWSMPSLSHAMSQLGSFGVIHSRLALVSLRVARTQGCVSSPSDGISDFDSDSG